jgi:hypothetical protein
MRLLALGAAVALLSAACGSTRTVTRTVTVSPPLAGSAVQDLSGHIVALTPTKSGYLLRFDPAWWLGGLTANVAAAEDEHVSCPPASCDPVPNDYYVVDESHRALTFVLPRAARGTVLTSGSNLAGTQIGADQLARIVAGHGLKLFEPLESGAWIRVRIDTVLTFRQQYRP